MGTPCSLWSIWHRHTGVAWHAVVAQCVPWVRVHSLNWMCALYRHIPYFGFTFSMSLLYCIGALDWLMKSVHIFAVTWQLGPMMTRNVDRFFFLEKKKKKIGTRKPEPKITQPQISCSCSVFPLRLCNVYSPFNVCTFIIQRRCSDLCSTHDARPTQCTQLKSPAQESATYRWRALNGLILQ